MASQLIALNKYPGFRLIGIGKTLHRVIGKAICMAILALMLLWSVAQAKCVWVSRLV